MGDPNRSRLDSHPLASQATFGVEIEFVVNPEMVLDDPYGGGYEDDGDSEYAKSCVEYFAEPLRKRLARAGLPTEMDEYMTTGRHDEWSVGDDGRDSDEGRPVLEIRGPILPNNQEGYEHLRKALTVIRDYVLSTKGGVLAEAGLYAAPNTGIHVHASNPGIRSGDAFDRLVQAASTDEEAIWDRLAQYDRPFERHAALNRMGDFDNHAYGQGLHDFLYDLGVQQAVRKGGSAVLSNSEVIRLLGSNRNYGTNINSNKPTVEYRYLTSLVLMEGDGVERVMEFVGYFVQNSLANTNKNQFTVRAGDGSQITFTRVPGGVRIDHRGGKLTDYRSREWGGTDYTPVPQQGLPAQQMRGHKGRPEGMGLRDYLQSDRKVYQAAKSRLRDKKVASQSTQVDAV